MFRLGKVNLVLIGLLCALIPSGCREGNIYAFKGQKIDLFEGQLFITLQPMTGSNYEENGKKKFDTSYPYHLTFAFEVDPHRNLSQLSISNVSLLGSKSRNQQTLEDKVSTKVYGPQSIPPLDIKLIHVDYSGLEKSDMEYEPITVTATIGIGEGEGSMRFETITVLLEPDFYKERRSDWYDEITGV